MGRDCNPESSNALSCIMSRGLMRLAGFRMLNDWSVLKTSRAGHINFVIGD